MRSSRPGMRIRAEPATLVDVPAWTDAHNFADLAGSQAVAWGPGDLCFAHNAGEENAVDEVIDATRPLEALLEGAHRDC